MTRHGGARRAHPPHQIRRQRGLAGDARRRCWWPSNARRSTCLSNGRLLPAFGIGSPLGPEWRTLNLDTKTRGRKTDEGLEIIRRLWREDKVDFDGRALPAVRRLDRAEAGAARSADVDRRLLRGGDPAHRADRHRLAGGARDAGAGRRRSSPRSRRPPPRRAARSTTTITAPASRSASAGPTIPGSRRCSRPTGSAPAAIRSDYFAIGDAEAIVDRIADYVAAGVSKFILRPSASGDDEMLAQTRRLIEEVLPAVAARWPKPAAAARGRGVSGLQRLDLDLAELDRAALLFSPGPTCSAIGPWRACRPATSTVLTPLSTNDELRALGRDLIGVPLAAGFGHRIGTLATLTIAPVP